MTPGGPAPERQPRSSFRRFIGIDLGGGRGKNTAVARLELTKSADGALRLGVSDAKIRYGQRGTGQRSDEPGGDAHFRDDVLVDYIDRWVDDTTVVGVNAPLTLPPCIRCTLPCPTVAHCDVPVVAWMRRWAPRLLPRGRGHGGKPTVTPYTQRATELMLMATGIAPRETLGQGTGPLAARAAYLRRHLSPRLRLHENLVEVHPRATLARLFGEQVERRVRTGETEAVWDARKDVLSRLPGDRADPRDNALTFDYVWPELVVRNTHVFAAVVCAFTTFLWATAPGPNLSLEEQPHVAAAAAELGHLWLEDGWIWAPARQ
jgi:predicted nuclease with RNAse H fold